MITKKQLQKENTELRAQVSQLKERLASYQYAPAVDTQDNTTIDNQVIIQWVKQYAIENQLTYTDRDLNQLSYLLIQNMFKSHKVPANYKYVSQPFYITVNGPRLKNANLDLDATDFTNYQSEHEKQFNRLNYLTRDLQRIVKAYDADKATQLLTTEKYYTKYYITAVQNSVYKAPAYQQADIENGNAIDRLIPAPIL